MVSYYFWMIAFFIFSPLFIFHLSIGKVKTFLKWRNKLKFHTLDYEFFFIKMDKTHYQSAIYMTTKIFFLSHLFTPLKLFIYFFFCVSVFWQVAIGLVMFYLKQKYEGVQTIICLVALKQNFLNSYKKGIHGLHK